MFTSRMTIVLEVGCFLELPVLSTNTLIVYFILCWPTGYHEPCCSGKRRQASNCSRSMGPPGSADHGHGSKCFGTCCSRRCLLSYTPNLIIFYTQPRRFLHWLPPPPAYQEYLKLFDGYIDFLNLDVEKYLSSMTHTTAEVEGDDDDDEGEGLGVPTVDLAALRVVLTKHQVRTGEYDVVFWRTACTLHGCLACQFCPQSLIAPGLFGKHQTNPRGNLQ